MEIKKDKFYLEKGPPEPKIVLRFLRHSVREEDLEKKEPDIGLTEEGKRLVLKKGQQAK